MPSRLAKRHQRQREQLADGVARAVLAEWAKVNPEAIARSWARLLPRVTAMVQAGQINAAAGTHTFMTNLLGDEAGPAIDPEQFGAAAPDGRDLTGLLSHATPVALESRSKGFSLRQAMSHAGSFLHMAVKSVVADTGRQADKVAMVTNRNATSWIRVVERPACARCIILAGREYSMSTGFQRHPNCDCTMEPVTRRHRPEQIDADDLFARMSHAERVRVFGEAGTRAIEDGARISSVVNARKGMATLEMHGRTVKATYAGTGRGRRKKPPRLMPEEIYRIAGDDRDEAIRLLYSNGYLR